MMKRVLKTVVLVILFPVVLLAQGIPIKSGVTSDLATVTTNKAMLTTQGVGTASTYVVSVLNVAYAVSESLINLEAESGRGFRIAEVCMNVGNQATATWNTWQLIRTTTASSAGTVISSESTTTHSVTKLDPGDSNWSGLARTGGTEGTSGSVIDQGTVFVPIQGTPPSQPTSQICRTYGSDGAKLPTVAAGIANGIKLMFTGAVGGGFQSAQIRFISCTGTPCI